MELGSNYLYEDNCSVNKDASKISNTLCLCPWFSFSCAYRLRLVRDWVCKDDCSIGNNIFKVIILFPKDRLIFIAIVQGIVLYTHYSQGLPLEQLTFNPLQPLYSL